jgi:hypothetical protein
MSTSSSRLVTAPPATVVGVERWRRERSKLRRELGRLDAVCLLIAAIVVLDTLGAVARGGPQTITWLAIVAAMFFLPAGLVIAELGAAFPYQGGPYVWARLPSSPRTLSPTATSAPPPFSTSSNGCAGSSCPTPASPQPGPTDGQERERDAHHPGHYGDGRGSDAARRLRRRTARRRGRQLQPHLPVVGDPRGERHPPTYGDIQSEIVGIDCRGRPVCALTMAIYRSEPWD